MIFKFCFIFANLCKELLPYRWMAPETLADSSVYSHKTDVWSFGIFLWELFTLAQMPYPNLKNEKLLDWLSEGNRNACPRLAPILMFELMLHCWRSNPSERPDFDEIYRSLTNDFGFNKWATRKSLVNQIESNLGYVKLMESHCPSVRPESLTTSSSPLPTPSTTVSLFTFGHGPIITDSGISSDEERSRQLTNGSSHDSTSLLSQSNKLLSNSNLKEQDYLDYLEPRSEQLIMNDCEMAKINLIGSLLEQTKACDLDNGTYGQIRNNDRALLSTFVSMKFK